MFKESVSLGYNLSLPITEKLPILLPIPINWRLPSRGT